MTGGMMMSPKKYHTKDYWLVTTEHLKEGVWFRDEEDYKVGMNYVAVLSFILGVTVLSFSLMSNHVHFVLYPDTYRRNMESGNRSDGMEWISDGSAWMTNLFIGPSLMWR